MILAWGAKVSPLFRLKAVDIATLCAIDPNWLMACMAFETGRTFSPSVRNPNSTAIGLIQFMASTAQGLGTSTEQLARMTAEEQLDVVHRYFKGFTGRIKSLADCYMAILWPNAVSEPDSAVIFPAGSREYLVNRGLDLNHDNAVTKAEAAAKVTALLAEGLRPENVADSDTQPAAPIEDRDLSHVPPRQEPMDPLTLIGVFGPIIANLIPQVGKLFGSGSDVSNRNIAAASTVLDTIVKATGAVNEQEAMSKIQNDPAALKTATEAVLTHPDIMPLLEVGGGIEKAREANLAVQNAEGPMFKNPAIFVTLITMPLVYIVVTSVTYGIGGGYTPETRAGLVQLIVGMVLGAVIGYFLGSTVASKIKDNTINNLAEKS